MTIQKIGFLMFLGLIFLVAIVFMNTTTLWSIAWKIAVIIGVVGGIWLYKRWKENKELDNHLWQRKRYWSKPYNKINGIRHSQK